MWIPYYEYTEILSEAGNTASFDIKGANYGSMQITTSENTGTIVIRIEASNDGTNWADITGTNTAYTEMAGNKTNIISMESRAKYIRGVFVSGTGKIKFVYVGGN